VTKYGKGQRKKNINYLAHSHTSQASFSYEHSSNVILDKVVLIQVVHVLLVLMVDFILDDFHFQWCDL